MFDQLRVRGPERIDQPAVGGETTVEVVFGFDEEAVARLMVGFENVQVAHEHRWSLGRAAANRWWSVFGKPRRGRSRRPGPAVHDDLVRREFAADRPNVLWCTDIERHEAFLNPAVWKDTATDRSLSIG
ncbi:hypothetical protein K8O92_22850 [Nocardia asteroides]|nr:hypothetical protein K8O92_22850 [Nocardia asteroides]